MARQRELIAAGRYVAEGRDIGTVVSPDSPLKVFLTASRRGARPAPRRRRPARTSTRSSPPSAERDRRDETREHGALRAAADAVEIDTTGLGPDEVVARIAALARRAGTGHEHDACPPSPSSAFPTSARAPWSTGWPAAARRSPTLEPGVTRDRKRVALRVERARLRAARHRRHRPRGRVRAGPRRPAPGAARDRRGRRGAAGRRRPRGRPRRRRRAGQDAARRRGPGRSSSSTKSTGPRTST